MKRATQSAVVQLSLGLLLFLATGAHALAPAAPKQAPAAAGVAAMPGATSTSADPPNIPAGATRLGGPVMSAVTAGPATVGAAATPQPQAAAAVPGAFPEPPPGPCDLQLTFFPPRADNLPAAWSQTVQQAAGNTAADQMIRISLAGYPIPKLHVAPISVFTTVGGSVPVGCITGQNAAGVGELVRPAAFSISWSLAGQSGQLGPFLKGSKQDPPANVTLTSAPKLPDGDYCLDVRMDLIPGSGTVSVGGQQFKVPTSPQSVSRQVCFVKLSTRPQANITFHSCNSSFAVDLTNITPPPIFSRPDLQLTSTVFRVWGKLNRTFDAVQQPADGLTDYFGQYVKWTDPTQPNVLQVFLESPGLINGYYDISIEGSLSSSVPDLNSLFGLDQYEDGTAKLMGNALRNSSDQPVPIQTVRSKISNLGGADDSAPATPGSAASFTWEIEGYGEQFCIVDGKRISNSADLVHCESPLALKVTDNRNHTLEVVLLDVCGQTTTSGIFFGSWGWRPNTKWMGPEERSSMVGLTPDTVSMPVPVGPIMPVQQPLEQPFEQPLPPLQQPLWPLRPLHPFNRTRWSASGADGAGKLKGAVATLLAGAAMLLVL